MLDRKENAPGDNQGARSKNRNNDTPKIFDRKRPVRVRSYDGRLVKIKGPLAWTLRCLKNAHNGLSAYEAETICGIPRIDNNVCALRKIIGKGRIKTKLSLEGNDPESRKWFARYHLCKSVLIEIDGGAND